VPSFYDRPPYHRLLGQEPGAGEGEEEVSYQDLAKQLFTKRIREETEARKISKPEDYLEFYAAMVRQQLDLTGLTHVEVMNDINLAQVFMWLQEKSLFGEAALVFNPAPGLFFTAVDMIRNLLVSPILTLSMAQQEELFQELWCRPVESFFRGPGTLDSFNTALNQFVVAKAEKLQFVSQGEKSYMAALSGIKSNFSNTRLYITTYAKFVSIMEKCRENIPEEGSVQAEIDVARRIAADISEFMKIKTLQNKINK